MRPSSAELGVILLDALVDLVPKQFHHVSGLRQHKFRVSYPYYHRSWPDNAIPVTLDSGPDSILVTATVSPAAFATLRYLGSVDGETSRELRYLTVHNAHEALLGSSPMEARAIRHSLAHASSELRDPAVVASLRSRFGGTRVDFGVHAHRREVFRCLGIMLVALDDGLYVELNEKYNKRLQSDALTACA